MHETLGTHVIAELGGCPAKLLNDSNYIDKVFSAAIELAGATLVQKVIHPFVPSGISMVYVLSESHLSIHSWPERGYCSVDMYTCGKCNPNLAIDYIRKHLNATSCHETTMNRGIPKSEEMFYHLIIERS